ncbi:hypothetical protein KR009_005996, partial [Drosophila setifemur]
KGFPVLVILVNLPFLRSLSNGKSPLKESPALSVVSMVPLINLEEKLIDNLEDFAGELEMKLKVLKRELSIMKAENEKARLDPLSYVTNPLNGFSLIRRLIDWPKIRKYMEQPVGIVQMRIFDGLVKELPTMTDFIHAGAGVDRIKEIYRLRWRDMFQGKLGNKQYNTTMTTADILAMGTFLSGINYWEDGILLLEEALHRISKDPQDWGAGLLVEEADVLVMLASNYIKANEYSTALDLMDRCLELKEHDAALTWFTMDVEMRLATGSTTQLEHRPPEREDITRGCRGLYEASTRLRCNYNSSTTPFLRLAPFKVEQIGEDPYAVLFHDVLSPQETAQLIELASRNDFEVATTYNPRSKHKENRPRTAKGHSLSKRIHELSRRITRRVEDMSGLDLSDSEPFQIINYGIGGHYRQHRDGLNSPDFNVYSSKEGRGHLPGDRTATVLFYLTDVEQGGATVFPRTGYSIFPRAGTALFWYNLHTDGMIDILTEHAACPVIMGSKW